MKFPKITHIDDVLPYIEGYPINKIDHGLGIVSLNYAVSFNELFYDDEDDIGSHMRRECRGIAFCSQTGEILSRPYHKFFNINEKPDTQMHLLPWDRPHVRMDKRDGSMIHVALVRGKLTFMSRGGVSDVSKDAWEYYFKNMTNDSNTYLMNMVLGGFTPILEWENPFQTIVLRHKEPRLVITNVRHRTTGAYVDPSIFRKDMPAPFVPVPKLGAVDDPETYLDMIRDLKGLEGEVVHFYEQGLFVKAKAAEYRNMHHFVTWSFKGRHLVQAVADSTIDDILPMLGDDHRPTMERHLQTITSYIMGVRKIITDLEKECQEFENEEQKFAHLMKTMTSLPNFVHIAMRYVRKKEDNYLDDAILTGIKYHSFKDIRFESFCNANGLTLPKYLYEE